MRLFNHTASTLPAGQFYAPLTPAPFPDVKLIALNETLAQEFGLEPDWLHSPDGLAFLSTGRRPDNIPPIAMAYAGHQFGQFVPSLGDGRALLAGELENRNGTLFELNLKGSGPTIWSRGGDGRCPLGPALREYLLSEAMHALGLPTTRTLAVVTTGEMIARPDGLQPGAVISRIGRSFLRVGSFEYFSARGKADHVRLLADFAINRLCPEAKEAENPYREFLEHCADKQAFLIAEWMRTGFIHGVMNTDNMALSGETLDYGPCAFLDRYEPFKVFSSIDQDGRYSYGRQPQIALWNLARLAEAILPLLGKNEQESIKVAEEVLGGFDVLFSHYWLEAFRRKLGLFTAQDKDIQLLEHLLETMHTGEADFTLAFTALGSNAAVFDMDYCAVREFFPKNKGHADLCRTDMMARLLEEMATPAERQKLMHRANPRLIPRNHLVEKAITMVLQGDDRFFHHLHHSLKTPYATPSDPVLERAPMPEEQVHATFCGT